MIYRYNQFLNEGLLDKMKGLSDTEIKKNIDKLLKDRRLGEIFDIIKEYDLSDEFYPSYEEVHDILNDMDFDLNKKLKFIIDKNIPYDKYLPKDEIKEYFDLINPLEQLKFVEKFDLPEEYKPSEKDIEKELEKQYKNKYFAVSHTFRRGIPKVFKVGFIGLAENTDNELVPAIELKSVDGDESDENQGVWEIDYINNNFYEVDLKELINKWEGYIKKYEERLDKYRKELNK